MGMDQIGFPDAAEGGGPFTFLLGCLGSVDNTGDDIHDWYSVICGIGGPGSGSGKIHPVLVDCSHDFGSGSGGVVDPSTLCDGSGSGSRFGMLQEWVINALPCTCNCEITLEITEDDTDGCGRDVPIQCVTAEACGMTAIGGSGPFRELIPGERVILAHIPGGDKVDAAGDPIEWFVVRACAGDACKDNPCQKPIPPLGPPCCGVACEDENSTLTATVEILSGLCNCTPPPITLNKQDLSRSGRRCSWHCSR